MPHRLRPPPAASHGDVEFDRRSPWFARLPRRNFYRALFLVAALLGVLLIRQAGGGFSALFDAFTPSAKGPGSAGDRPYRIQVIPPGEKPAAPRP